MWDRVDGNTGWREFKDVDGVVLYTVVLTRDLDERLRNYDRRLSEMVSDCHTVITASTGEAGTPHPLDTPHPLCAP